MARVAPERPSAASASRSGMGELLVLVAGEDDGLAHPGEGELAFEGGGSRGIRRHPRGHVERDPECVKPPHLLPDCTVERGIPGVHARDVLAVRVRRLHLGDDLFEGHRRGVEHPGTFGCALDHLARHERTREEHDGTRLDEPPAAHRDELGIAGAGANEMDRHGERLPAVLDST